MKRRSFLKGAALSGAAVTAAATTSSFPTPAISQGLKEWKMVMSWPLNAPGSGTQGRSGKRSGKRSGALKSTRVARGREEEGAALAPSIEMAEEAVMEPVSQARRGRMKVSSHSQLEDLD